MDIWEHISGLYGIPGSYYWHSRQTCDLCLLPEGYSIPFKHLGREHVPVDGMWALKGFFLSHTNSWRCFFNFEDAQKASLRPCFEPCLRPDQTWETTRFREVERQGLTQESCMGSSAEKERDSQDSFPGSVQLRLGRHVSLCWWESQAGNQSPELCKMLWSCEWRGVPLLSGTFLFAVVRPYLNHKHFWVDGLRVHQSAHLT